MNRRTGSALESVVTAAILLVLAQGFLEDFSALGGWGLEWRRPILLAGFLLDLFFTVEFLARLFGALLQGRAWRYLARERGWVDFLVSVPLLMFASGPLAAALLIPGAAPLGSGGAFVLPGVVKMIRLVRTLRFLRVLKLLRRARTVDSVMARRHASRAASLAVCTAVCALLLSSLLAPESGAGGTEAAWDARQARTAARLVEAGPDPAALSRALGALQESEGSLLLVRLEGRPLFARHEDGYFRRYFTPGDYAYLRKEALEIFFDERPLSRGRARESLPFHLVALLLALAFLLLYGPHFAWTVCDPLRVMRRGLRETGHGRPVEIPERYREDEVFLLARAYNERCLPAREDEGARANGSLPDLDDDDIKNLLERESR